MTANQYRAALDRLGLTQVGAARLFGVGERTSRRWAEEGVEGTAAILLGLMASGKITIEDVRRFGTNLTQRKISEPKSKARAKG